MTVGWLNHVVLVFCLPVALGAVSPVSVRADEPPPCRVVPEKVDLNAAAPEQLQTLPGIGAARAADIVALRRRLRGYRHLAQLLRVRGIGRKTLRKIKPLVILGQYDP